VESTVYRRGSDGKVIGTPEAKPVIEQPVLFSQSLRHLLQNPKFLRQNFHPLNYLSFRLERVSHDSRDQFDTSETSSLHI
jgi:hypothetical protein